MMIERTESKPWPDCPADFRASSRAELVERFRRVILIAVKAGLVDLGVSVDLDPVREECHDL